MRLYPGDMYLQAEWLRAVRVVRSTQNGWLLDRIPLTVPPHDARNVFLLARRLS